MAREPRKVLGQSTHVRGLSLLSSPFNSKMDIYIYIYPLFFLMHEKNRERMEVVLDHLILKKLYSLSPSPSPHSQWPSSWERTA